MKNKVYLLLGSNLGDSIAILEKCRTLIQNEIGEISTFSSLYKTAAWGKTEQNDFINQVLIVESDIDAFKILDQCLSIEQKLGRIRKEKWSERAIDIDILFYNNEVINTPNLTIPHPYLHLRKFTLIPLAEISKNYVHPSFNKSINQLLLECDDSLVVLKIV